jgi:hypothetical protein
LTRAEIGGIEHEVWSINDCPNVGARHFQLHGLRHMRERHGTEYFLWLSSLEAPVYFFPEQLGAWPSRMTEFGLHGLPRPMQAAEFPWGALVDHYGQYFTGSFPWLIAFAMWRHETGVERIEELRLVGVNFSQDGLWKSRRQAADWLEVLRTDSVQHNLRGKWEPSFAAYVERIEADLRGEGGGDESWAVPCIEHRLGIARGVGIRCYVEPSSGLHFNKWGEDVLYGLTGRGSE